MNRQLRSIAGALVMGALIVPVAQAADRSNAFTGLGHEGSGLKVKYSTNPFTGMGHEGSGLKVTYPPNPFTGMGHEGSGLTAKWEAARMRPWAN
jgi:hypothetical protein